VVQALTCLTKAPASLMLVSTFISNRNTRHRGRRCWPFPGGAIYSPTLGGLSATRESSGYLHASTSTWAQTHLRYWTNLVALAPASLLMILADSEIRSALGNCAASSMRSRSPPGLPDGSVKNGRLIQSPFSRSLSGWAVTLVAAVPDPSLSTG